MNEPSHWTSNLSKATWTILFVALGVFVAWQLLRQALPIVIALACLLFIYRLVVGWQRRYW